MAEHKTFHEALRALTSRPHQITVAPDRGDDAEIARRVARELNKPGGPKLRRRAIDTR